jgi:putative methyltransferase (TIGR04325 family)
MRDKTRDLIRFWLSPGLIRIGQRVVGLFRPPALVYIPEGWNSSLASRENAGWNVSNVAAAEEGKWRTFMENCKGTGPLGFSHESSDLTVVRNLSFHNINMTYAYVLALAAQGKSSLTMLDWGGALGHYYLVGKALLPDLKIDFHCKEVPLMAEVGRRLNPDVHWYSDESCLTRKYDLIMMNGSLQYIQDWTAALGRIASSVVDYLFLARVPVVQRHPGYVAVQRVYGRKMLHPQINQGVFLEVVQGLGFSIAREFIVGDRPYVKGAPEQCELRSWLFKRERL